MGQWKRVAVDSDIDIYVCDSHPGNGPPMETSAVCCAVLTDLYVVQRVS